MRRGGGTSPGVDDCDDDADADSYDAVAKSRVTKEANHFLLRWHRLAMKGESTMGDVSANRRCFDSYVDGLADDDADVGGDDLADEDEADFRQQRSRGRRSFVAFLGTDAAEVWTSKRDFVAAISGRGEGRFGWSYRPVAERDDGEGGDDFHVTSTDGFRRGAQFWATLVGKKTDGDTGRCHSFLTRCFGALVRVGAETGDEGSGEWRVAFYDLSLCIAGDKLPRVLDLCGYRAGGDGSVGAPPTAAVSEARPRAEGDDAPATTNDREEAFLRFMNGAMCHLSLPWRGRRRQQPPEGESNDNDPTYPSNPNDWEEFANLFAPSADGGGCRDDYNDGSRGGGGASPASSRVVVRWIGTDASEMWGVERLVRERGGGDTDSDSDTVGRRPSANGVLLPLPTIDVHDDAATASYSCFSLDDYRTGGNWYATVTTSASFDVDDAAVDVDDEDDEDGSSRTYAFPLRLSGYNVFLPAKTVAGLPGSGSGSGSWAIGRCKASVCVPNRAFYRVLDIIYRVEEDGADAPPPTGGARFSVKDVSA